MLLAAAGVGQYQIVEGAALMLIAEISVSSVLA